MPWIYRSNANGPDMPISEETPLRVLVIISDKSVYWKESWISSEAILPVAFQVLSDTQILNSSGTHGSKMTLLAKTRRDTQPASFLFLTFRITTSIY